jgi:hypothetical protein
MQVANAKTFALSFVVTGAINYFAAFNLVGWNFLLPGRYTFGLLSLTCLLLVTLSSLAWLSWSTAANALASAAGAILAVLFASFLIGSGFLALKDYFIWGLPASTLIAVIFTVLVFRASQSRRTVGVGVTRAAFLLACIVLLTVGSWAMNVTPDVQQFLRQQAYLLTMAFVFSAALLFFWQRFTDRTSDVDPARGPGKGSLP